MSSFLTHDRAIVPSRRSSRSSSVSDGVFPSRSGARSRGFTDARTEKRPMKCEKRREKRCSRSTDLRVWRISPTPARRWSLRFNFSGLAASLSFPWPFSLLFSSVFLTRLLCDFLERSTPMRGKRHRV